MRNVTVSINLLINAPPSVDDDELADHILETFTDASDFAYSATIWCEGVEVYVDDIEELDFETS